LPKKTKQHLHKQQTTPKPQPHKIEAQEIKDLQQLVEFKKSIHKPPNLRYQTKKKDDLVSCIRTKKSNWLGFR